MMLSYKLFKYMEPCKYPKNPVSGRDGSALLVHAVITCGCRQPIVDAVCGSVNHGCTKGRGAPGCPASTSISLAQVRMNEA